MSYPDTNETEKMPARDFLLGCRDEEPFKKMQDVLEQLDEDKRLLFKLPLGPEPAEVV
jgi:hypothetical protein